MKRFDVMRRPFLRHICLPIRGLVFGAAVLLDMAAARADAPTACASTITRSNVGACAVTASLAAKSERLGLESIEGRRRAAAVVLPSNPYLSFGGAYTIDPSVASSDRQALWSVTLSQELEIAGQRGKRLGVVEAEQRAQEARLEIVRRETAAEAWNAYFEALAAGEQARVAARLGPLAGALETIARAHAEAGLTSKVEAQLAASAAARLAHARIAAEQRVATTSAMLAAIVGLDPAQARPRAEGELVPLIIADAPAGQLLEAAVARRSEVAGAIAERDTYERKASLLVRSRFPNPTLSIFARNDWIGERSVGVGVGFPIPLPSPLGRTYAGEITEATVLAQRADSQVERLRRAVRLELVTALEVVAARKKQLELYSPAQVRETEDTLRSIADEIQARRLPVREALVTQQGLIDLLFAYVEARRSLCVASVELARAAGVRLDRGEP